MGFGECSFSKSGIRRGPPKLNLFINLCIYSYMLKLLHSPSKNSPFDAIQLLRCFFHCSEQFFSSLLLITFSASTIFCFTSSISAKHFSWSTFFIGETEKVTWSKISWIGRVGHGGHAGFGQNLWSLSTVWAGVLVNHPSWNGQTL